MDTSDSIKYSNFEKIKEFGRKLTENFDFDDAKTSLSLVTFNENAESVLENETDPDLIQDTLKGNRLKRQTKFSVNRLFDNRTSINQFFGHST